MKSIKILTPTGGVGCGFPIESLKEGLKKRPDIIASDGGSIDPGPYYLGSDQTTMSLNALERDLTYLIEASTSHKIPLIIGSAGGTGTRLSLQKTKDIIRKIVKKNKLKLKMASIDAELDKNFLKKELKAGKIKIFESNNALTSEDIDNATHIVAQMGVEPFIEAMKYKPDVIIGGRAYDPAVIAAVPIMKGFDPGLSYHMGQILECASMAAEPGSGFEPIIGEICKYHFDVKPVNKNFRCTPQSVAAHSFYEKPNPIELPLPGGILNISNCEFKDVGNRAVRVTGSLFKSNQCHVKLEGAKSIGYRSLYIGGMRDPVAINHLDEIIDKSIGATKNNFPEIPENNYQIHIHRYGQNAVLKACEFITSPAPHEIGIVIEVIAKKTQDIAYTICSKLSHTMMHQDYTGLKSGSGNLANLFSPRVIDIGAAYKFNIYHLLEAHNPLSIFPIEIENL